MALRLKALRREDPTCFALVPSIGKKLPKPLRRDCSHVSVSINLPVRCWYCGTFLIPFPHNHPAFWTKDHLVPKSRGGTRHPLNLVDACCACNSHKDSKTYEQFRLYCGGPNVVFWGEYRGYVQTMRKRNQQDSRSDAESLRGYSQYRQVPGYESSGTPDSGRL